MKKHLKWLIPLCVVIIVLVAWLVLSKGKSKPEWRFDEVALGDITEEVTASGTINPVTVVNVGTEVSGKISKITKDYNSIVRKGELLATLDTEILETNFAMVESEVSKARSTLKDTKIDLDLAKELMDKKMGTLYDYQKAQIKYDQAYQNLENSKLNLKRAQTNLNNASITSPIDGVIISRNVDEGQTVAASLNSPTLFVIANNLEQMQIEASVDEADIGRVKVGMPVRFTVDAFADDNFRGKVRQIRLSSTVEQNVVSYSVIISVNNYDHRLMPGMTANVSIVVAQKENILRAPQMAMNFKPSKEVWEAMGLDWEAYMAERKKMREKMGFGGHGMEAGGKDSSKSMTKAAVGEKVQGKSDKVVHGNNESQRGEGFGNMREKFQALPDSIKEKMRNMSREERREYFSQMGQNKQAGMGMKNRKGDKVESSGQGSWDQMLNASTSGNDFSRKKFGRVWVIENGKPTMVRVETGITDGTYLEIVSGLKPGQKIITGVDSKDMKKNSNNQQATPFGGMGRRM